MSHLDPKRPATTSELRHFGLLVGAVFLAIGAVTFLRNRSPIVFGSVGAIGAILVLMGIVAPRGLARVYARWMGLAVLMSKVTTPIFMGAIYFVIITPFGFVMRLFGRDPLGRATSDSIWITRPVGARRSDLQRQF